MGCAQALPLRQQDCGATPPKEITLAKARSDATAHHLARIAFMQSMPNHQKCCRRGGEFEIHGKLPHLRKIADLLG
jgi:hypothetical protein